MNTAIGVDWVSTESLFDRPKYRWKDEVARDFTTYVGFESDLESRQCSGFVNTMMNVRFP